VDAHSHIHPYANAYDHTNSYSDVHEHSYGDLHQHVDPDGDHHRDGSTHVHQHLDPHGHHNRHGDRHLHASPTYPDEHGDGHALTNIQPYGHLVAYNSGN